MYVYASWMVPACARRSLLSDSLIRTHSSAVSKLIRSAESFVVFAQSLYCAYDVGSVAIWMASAWSPPWTATSFCMYSMKVEY